MIVNEMVLRMKILNKLKDITSDAHATVFFRLKHKRKQSRMCVTNPGFPGAKK